MRQPKPGCTELSVRYQSAGGVSARHQKRKRRGWRISVGRTATRTEVEEVMIRYESEDDQVGKKEHDGMITTVTLEWGRTRVASPSGGVAEGQACMARWNALSKQCASGPCQRGERLHDQSTLHVKRAGPTPHCLRPSTVISVSIMHFTPVLPRPQNDTYPLIFP